MLRLFIAMALAWPMFAWATPEIETWETMNGAKVLFVAAPELPMIDVRIAFYSRSAHDAGKAGLATLTNGMLDEGANGWSAEKLSERFEAVGARFSSSLQRDVAWIGVRSLADEPKLKQALDTLAMVATGPDFPERALERSRKLMLVSLQQRAQQPDEIAEDAFYSALYGAHPYASPPHGTEKSIKALTRADIVSFYKRYYVGRNAVIGIVGNVNRKQAEAIANQLIGKLPAGEKAEATLEVPALKAPQAIRIKHPSSQSHILIGQPAMRRVDPDFYPLYLGNHCLGGSGLVSILADEIREKRGLSYSVYSYFLGLRQAGPFMSGIETRNDQVDESVKVLRTAIVDYAANGPSAEKFKAAVKNITGGFPLRIDSNGKILEYLVTIGIYGLPLDYLDRFIERVEAVTLDQVRDAFKRRLAVDNMVTVIVGGDPKPGEPAQATPSPPPLRHDLH